MDLLRERFAEWGLTRAEADVARARELDAFPVDHDAQKLKLLRESSATLRDAWLKQTGHKRPGVKGGLPVAEAEARSAQILKDYLN